MMVRTIVIRDDGNDAGDDDKIPPMFKIKKMMIAPATTMTRIHR